MTPDEFRAMTLPDYFDLKKFLLEYQQASTPKGSTKKPKRR